MIKRRPSKPLQIGNVTVGGGFPVVVQSMTKTDTRDVPATAKQINELAESGCEIIRIAVPDAEAATAIASIKTRVAIPIIADIHFDYRLALSAINNGADALRLNPGNIRDKEQIQQIVKKAKERKIPIRIGVNFGSLPESPEEDVPVAVRMVNLVMEQVDLLEQLDFDLIKIAVKAFDVVTAVEAYRIIAARTVYPLHIGITESGLPKTGIIRSSVGLGILLNEGIGDTLRVSLSTHPKEEVFVAYEILKSLNLRQHGPVLVSCPSCGRSETDIFGLAEIIGDYLLKDGRPIKVAVMGCIVNGPGEARDADVGIACGKGRGAIFKKGSVVKTVMEKDFAQALIQEINNL